MALAALIVASSVVDGEAEQGLLKPVYLTTPSPIGNVVITSTRTCLVERLGCSRACARAQARGASAPTNPVNRPTAIHGSADGPNPSSDGRGTGHRSTHNAPLGDTSRRTLDNGLGRCSAHGQSDRCHQQKPNGR